MLRRLATAARESATAVAVLAIAWLRGLLARGYHRLTAVERWVGLSRAEEALAQARLSACSVCPLKRGDFCGACGCYMPAKARITEAKCPKGKW